MSIEGNNEQAPATSLELLPMAPSDLEAYIALEKAVESRTYVAAQNLAEAEEEYEKGPMFFIKQGDTVVGAASYIVEEDGRVYINGLSVSPEYQGQGLGSRVLDQILGQVQGAPQVWLRTHPENPAVKLYESRGFKITAKEENYEGTGEPRSILVRDQT